MLLTLTTTWHPATDVGYLLHKNPNAVHSVALPFGMAYVVYPEATAERCTAALLLDIDPIGLVRKNNPTAQHFVLEPYVNDRPYVASSFMSVAIGRVFGTLLSGSCKERPALVDQPLPLEVTLAALPCRGGENLLHRLFAPLGYSVEASPHMLDEKYPDWGNSPYFTVTLRHTCPVRQFLTHLYVLIPVLDNDKHYWISDDEVSKLVRFGEGWLAEHPEKNLITHRYLKHFRSLSNEALLRLEAESQDDALTKEAEIDTPAAAQVLEKKKNLNMHRLDWVEQTLRIHEATSVADLGCGEGRLLQRLAKSKQYERLLGADVSLQALQVAKERLDHTRLPPQAVHPCLIQTALTYQDERLRGYDAVTLIEVIEHLDLSRLEALERVVFEYATPRLVIVTTPNAEYNSLYDSLPEGHFRHTDHRFEWSRAQFQEWAHAITARHGYSVSFDGIGEENAVVGTSTQAGIFTRHD